jgi:ABC-type multidrug transport system fused ATPase/permease subunit
MKFSVLLQYVTPHKRTLFAIVALLLLGSVISLANPWIAGQLTGVVLNESDVLFTNISWILVAWLALLTVKSLLSFATSYLIGCTGADMAARLRGRVYQHLQILPMNYYQDRRPGDLLTLLSRDSEVISGFVTNTLVGLLPLIVTFFGAFVIMVWLDSLIAFLAVLLMPVYYVAMKLIAHRIRPLTASWIKSWSAMVSLVQENLGLLPVIKAFVREPLEAERFENRNANLLNWSRRQILIQSMLSPAISLLAGAGLLLLLWVGFSHMETGRLDTSDLVSLLLYAMLLTGPVSGLANVYGQVMLTRGAAERLLDFFAVQQEPVNEDKPPIQDVRGKIEFRDVSFAYPARPEIISGFKLEIAAGETIALTGPNGAGKTTLAHLLMRFIEPSHGSIQIDDTDIREVSLHSVRDQVGLVAQNTLLLNGTVAENIAYGRHLASTEEIEKAAKAARADAFIEELPDQYDTVIGDQGIKLSGGQRQRLSLARTLLKDPPILILDEATAMFDPEGERSFIEECHDLLRQQTVILITHRPASLALADRVLRMEPGCRELIDSIHADDESRSSSIP